MCAAGGACAFPDADCESGHRYGDHAGSMSGQCVPPFDTTTGADDAGSSGDSPTTIDPSTVSDSLEDSSPDATTLLLDTSTTDVDPTSPVSMSGDSSSSGGAGTTGDPNDDPDLLVWLRFTSMDDEGVVNDGVLGGHAACSMGCPDLVGGLAIFDGASCLSFPHEDELASTTWTAATWVLPERSVTPYNMVGKAYGAESGNSWELFADEGPMMSFRSWVVASGASVDGPPPEGGAWMHVAATYDGGTLALYTNGELAGTVAVDVVVFDDNPVRFGCDADSGVENYHLAGLLADTRIYKRALDEPEIDALVAEPPPDP